MDQDSRNEEVAVRFEGRAAFVTGAAHGIGRAVADRLSAEGASVAYADVDAVDPPGGSAVGLVCDVTDRESVDAAVAAAYARFGRLDILVSVAGGAHDLPLTDVDDETWHRELDLNLTGAMRCVRAALPALRRQPAAVVFVSSVNGLIGFGNEPYSAAKAGLSSYARNLAIELGPAGVRVNVVAPGTVRTRVWDAQPGGADRLVPTVPLGRIGEPADIAAAVAFLVSDDAAWITGITLPVDGGLLAGPRQLLPLLDRLD